MNDSSPSETTVDVEALRRKLEPHGQTGLLRFWDELSPAQQAQLASQIEAVDFDLMEELYAGKETTTDFDALARRSSSPPAVKADGTGAAWSPDEAFAKGEAAIRAGQVAAIIVAGGQGTRLGFDQPKGMFPIGPLSQRTLFQVFADRLLAIGYKYGVHLQLYLMTSPATHDETVAYWEQHDYLGLRKEDLHVFCQGTMPAVDKQSGKILMDERDALALSPDGHGGTVAAFEKSGCLDHAEQSGIRYLSYGQVDNPLVELCDPALIGHHIAAGSELTTQVVRKRYPTEKVGNVVLVDGRLQIIEYSDLPESAALQTNEAGELKLWAGSIAVHVFDIPFLRRMSRSADALPFHRANKKVPYLDQAGNRVEPSEPNAVKFERFIFDLLPAAENAFVVEGLPVDIFAPVKNADGAENDTPALAKQAMTEKDKRRLAEIGVKVDEGVRVEINPRFAFDTEQLREKFSNLPNISEDTYFAP